MFVPMLLDDDEDPAEINERNIQRTQSVQMSRLSRNPNISSAEYETVNAKVGNPGGLPPKPGPGELEKRLELEDGKR
jgi:hypothetical protein